MNAKILIADDESDIVSMLGSFFESKGFRVLPASNGAEALKQVEKQPDIILLDINMPGTDGLEVCKRIRDHISCPILFQLFIYFPKVFCTSIHRLLRSFREQPNTGHFHSAEDTPSGTIIIYPTRCHAPLFGSLFQCHIVHFAPPQDILLAMSKTPHTQYLCMFARHGNFFYHSKFIVTTSSKWYN